MNSKLIVRSSCYLLDNDLNKQFLPAASTLNVLSLRKHEVSNAVNVFSLLCQHKNDNFEFKVMNVIGTKNYMVSSTLKGVMESKDYSRINSMKFENVFLESFDNFL